MEWIPAIMQYLALLKAVQVITGNVRSAVEHLSLQRHQGCQSVSVAQQATTGQKTRTIDHNQASSENLKQRLPVTKSLLVAAPRFLDCASPSAKAGDQSSRYHLQLLANPQKHTSISKFKDEVNVGETHIYLFGKS